MLSHQAGGAVGIGQLFLQYKDDPVKLGAICSDLLGGSHAAHQESRDDKETWLIGIAAASGDDGVVQAVTAALCGLEEQPSAAAQRLPSA